MTGGHSNTPTEFRVDLAALEGVITTVRRERTVIADNLSNVRHEVRNIWKSWDSPASATFGDVGRWFDTSATNMLAVLDEIILRLETALANYRNAEQTNYGNLNFDTGRPVQRVVAWPEVQHKVAWPKVQRKVAWPDDADGSAS